MSCLQPPGCPKMDKQKSLPYWVNIQADLSLCWSHKSYCRFSYMLAQILSGPSCSKLTMSLVNDSLKFTSSDTQIF